MRIENQIVSYNFKNMCWEHSAILSTFIKLPFADKTFVLSIFEWSLKTGFTVVLNHEKNNVWEVTIFCIPLPLMSCCRNMTAN